ncbi:hypothetical protein RND71_042071 [Anisodus tanguticus]|uniref:Xylanase inhibitor C-terminal domain-containing protein n=1 Tax=Anisodus tanguticus TaxID=243964 RepID=A0AAE1UUG8_9SOLA|nr:hypothetical protein RND71_042071 [Anisodus tanguticus]
MSLDPTKLPDPPMPSYTFSIYHRDVFEKSKFKNYYSLLESRLARCHARANYLASVLVDVYHFDTCYANPDDRMLFFLVVKLYFGSVNMRNKLALAQERLVVNIHGLYCLAFIGWKSEFSILGVHQLQGVGLTFDTSANTLYFDLDKCD